MAICTLMGFRPHLSLTALKARSDYMEDWLGAGLDGPDQDYW